MTCIPNQPQRSIRAIFLIALSMGLWACGDITVREYNAARWEKRDTSFVYIRHTLKGQGSGGSLGRPDHTSYSSSVIEVMKAQIGPNGFHSQVVLYRMNNIVPCGELVYRPGDSILSLSFLNSDGLNGVSRHYCQDTLRSLIVGKLSGNLWTRFVPDSLSRLAYLTELAQSRILAQQDGGLVIDSAFERLCVNGLCKKTPEP